MNSDEKERALNELVFKIKEYSIDKKLKNLTDITKLQSLMIEKNKIQNRDKMHISLKDGQSINEVIYTVDDEVCYIKERMEQYGNREETGQKHREKICS